MKKEVIIEIIAALFVILFVYAALTKLLDYEKFRIQIGQSPLLTAFSEVILWAIPSAEIVISVFLITSRFRLIALYAAFSLMVSFTAYIIAILNFSEYVPCSCGGILEKFGWTEHLIFNIGFLLLALTGILLYSDAKTKNTELA